MTTTTKRGRKYDRLYDFPKTTMMKKTSASSLSPPRASVSVKKKFDRPAQSSEPKTTAVFNPLHATKTGNNASASSLSAKNELIEDAMQSSSSPSSSSIPAKKKLDRAVQSSGMKTVAVFNRLHESKTGNDALAAKKKLKEGAMQSSSMAASISAKQKSDRAVRPSGTKTDKNLATNTEQELDVKNKFCYFAENNSFVQGNKLC